MDIEGGGGRGLPDAARALEEDAPRPDAAGGAPPPPEAEIGGATEAAATAKKFVAPPPLPPAAEEVGEESDSDFDWSDDDEEETPILPESLRKLDESTWILENGAASLSGEQVGSNLVRSVKAQAEALRNVLSDESLAPEHMEESVNNWFLAVAAVDEKMMPGGTGMVFSVLNSLSDTQRDRLRSLNPEILTAYDAAISTSGAAEHAGAEGGSGGAGGSSSARKVGEAAAEVYRPGAMEDPEFVDPGPMANYIDQLSDEALDELVGRFPDLGDSAESLSTRVVDPAAAKRLAGTFWEKAKIIAGIHAGETGADVLQFHVYQLASRMFDRAANLEEKSRADVGGTGKKTTLWRNVAEIRYSLMDMRDQEGLTVETPLESADLLRAKMIGDSEVALPEKIYTKGKGVLSTEELKGQARAYWNAAVEEVAIAMGPDRKFDLDSVERIANQMWADKNLKSRARDRDKRTRGIEFVKETRHDMAAYLEEIKFAVRDRIYPDSEEEQARRNAGVTDLAPSADREVVAPSALKTRSAYSAVDKPLPVPALRWAGDMPPAPGDNDEERESRLERRRKALAGIGKKTVGFRDEPSVSADPADGARRGAGGDDDS